MTSLDSLGRGGGATPGCCCCCRRCGGNAGRSDTASRPLPLACLTVSCDFSDRTEGEGGSIVVVRRGEGVLSREDDLAACSSSSSLSSSSSPSSLLISSPRKRPLFSDALDWETSETPPVDCKDDEVEACSAMASKTINNNKCKKWVRLCVCVLPERYGRCVALFALSKAKKETRVVLSYTSSAYNTKSMKRIINRMETAAHKRKRRQHTKDF